MSYKILCLHGMGCQASVLASQLDCLREILPASYSFHIPDGTVECEASEEVAGVFPGPYLCWYKTPTTAAVAKAHDRLKDIIRMEGPFDAILGFSQGAALAASLLLHYAIDMPNEPLPFKAAIFICSPIPFSTSTEHGIDTRFYFGFNDRSPHSRRQRPNRIPDYLVTDPNYLKGRQHMGNGASPNYQMFHHTVDDQRIKIPTLHIYGRKDKWRLHSMDLFKLCSRETAACFEHDGGHEIPARQADEIADAIEGLTYKTLYKS